MNKDKHKEAVSKDKTQAVEEGTAQDGGLLHSAFRDAPDRIMQRINASIHTDKRLYREDIAQSLAHAEMLAAQEIISEKDSAAIKDGLQRIQKEIEAGQMAFSEALEDIHIHIEQRLTELVGDAGKRLHTARSRNDQVATDFRLYLRRRTQEHIADITALVAALLNRAEEHVDTIMPGFTHLQSAQPITFGHHLHAYAEMFLRDRGRLEDSMKRLNECPLGAAALAGTSYPINRRQTADALGFDRPMANSLDAVSARDFALEYLGALTILSTHLSRLAEEFVLWASTAFGFVDLGDKFTTGSSIMPQKRNPDAAELVRAKVGSISSAFLNLTMVLKGLPLAYSKDMQEDKAPAFEAGDHMDLMLAAMRAMVEAMTLNKDAMRASAGAGYATATELADALVRDLGMPFRDAYHITGQLVRHAASKGIELADLPEAVIKDIDTRLSASILAVTRLNAAVAAKTSAGGTAPQCVRKAIETTRKML